MESLVSAVPQGAYCELNELIRLRYPARELKLGRQRRVFSRLTGPHQGRFRGRGIEFEEVRIYQPGDDIRNIDWRVTARSGKPHTKLFCEERERPMLLLIDQSLAMFFGSRNCFKSVLAAHAAALLAWAALQNNDRVGGLIFNGLEHAEIRAKRSSRTVLQLLKQISDFNHRLRRSFAPADSAIDPALEELRRITRPGANIFILSDFRGLSENGIKHLHLLGKHNDITAIRIFDPLEEHLPPDGQYTITDGENRLSLHSGDPRLRHRYRERFRLAGEDLSKKFGSMGIPVLPLSTLDSPLSYFRELLGGKK
ncbi:MAG: DUF58 domain-containing protein [Desulfurivibrionaceae bacterium]|nr:DUF58 domain-containing protein [Desulfurivibrionaceae bacterium]